MSTQWHPIIARLLNLQLGEFYEVQTEVPVSDLPRAGDFLILRRQGTAEPPFRGLWLNLTDVNVVEFKGPSDDPAAEHLDKFAHVGTGLAYRLNEQRAAEKQERLSRRQVSFWYIARSLGRTFLDEVRGRTELKYEGGGLYTGKCWGYRVFFVSAQDMVVEEDTVPLWLVEGDPLPPNLAEFVAGRAEVLRRYAEWIVRLRPEIWAEVKDMARSSEPIDWREVARVIDFDKVGPFLEPREVIEGLGVQRAIEAIGTDRAIEAIGTDRAIEAIGTDRTLDALLARVSPEQLQEMLRQRQKPTAPPEGA